MDSSTYILRDYSLPATSLIPPDDEPAFEECDELDAKRARYARLGKLLDLDDLMEVICSRLTDSMELRHIIEDAIEDPHDERPRLHISDALRLGDEVVRMVAEAVDEKIGLLDVVVPD